MNCFSFDAVLKRLKAISESDGRKHFNIYHDSNVPEAVMCRPVLNALAQKVSELLSAFPEHPTLTQVCVLSSDVVCTLASLNFCDMFVYFNILHFILLD